MPDDESSCAKETDNMASNRFHAITMCPQDSYTGVRRAAMKMIPLEILLTILGHTLSSDGEFTFDATKAPFVLLRVCHLWRNLALSVSSLWATLNIRITGRTDRRTLQALDFWLKLSRHQPLSVSLVYKPPRHTLQRRFNDISVEVVRRLLCHASRWRHARFDVPSSTAAPLFVALANGVFRDVELASFALDMQGVWCLPFHEAGGTALLQSVRLDRLTEFTCSLDMDALLTVEDMYRVFEAGTHLIKCSLTVKLNSRPERSISDERRLLVLTSLKEVDLAFHYARTDRDPPIPASSLCGILDTMVFPEMEKFSITWPTETGFSEHEEIVHCLSSFLARARGTLRSLGLHYLPMRSAQTITMLEQVPMLMDLDIRPSTDEYISDTLLGHLCSFSRDGRRVLPDLQSLVIHDAHQEWTIASMRALIAERQLTMLELYVSATRCRELKVFEKTWRAEGLDVVLNDL